MSLDFANPGGADAVVELEIHADGRDQARVDGRAAPGAAGDADVLLVLARAANQPPATR